MLAAVGRRLGLTLVVMVLLLAGCGDDDTATDDATTTTTGLSTTTVSLIGSPCYGLVEVEADTLPEVAAAQLDEFLAVPDLTTLCEVDGGTLLVLTGDTPIAGPLGQRQPGWSSMGIGVFDDCSSLATDDWPQELVPADDQSWWCVMVEGPTADPLGMVGLEPET